MAYTRIFQSRKELTTFCRQRYGNAKQVWDDPELWANWGYGRYALDLEAADKLFLHNEDEEEYDHQREEEIRREDMMAYINSGSGLDNFYKDEQAGYAGYALCRKEWRRRRRW